MLENSKDFFIEEDQNNISLPTNNMTKSKLLEAINNIEFSPELHNQTLTN